VEGGQTTPFEIVHLNVFTPIVKPVTPDVGEVGVVTVAPPVITVHAPVPIVAVFAASVATAVAHTNWSGPAAEVVGIASLTMVISFVDGTQTPFVIVHLKVLTPTLNPVTPDVGEVGVVTVAEPAITVQAPVPKEGVFPANVAVVPQTAWSGPAAETVGFA
jgi:hypothetical protein